MWHHLIPGGLAVVLLSCGPGPERKVAIEVIPGLVLGDTVRSTPDLFAELHFIPEAGYAAVLADQAFGLTEAFLIADVGEEPPPQAPPILGIIATFRGGTAARVRFTDRVYESAARAYERPPLQGCSAVDRAPVQDVRYWTSGSGGGVWIAEPRPVPQSSDSIVVASVTIIARGANAPRSAPRFQPGPCP